MKDKLMGIDLKALAYIRSAKDAPAYWNVGGLFMILAEAKDTGGAFSIMEQLTPNRLLKNPLPSCFGFDS